MENEFSKLLQVLTKQLEIQDKRWETQLKIHDYQIRCLTEAIKSSKITETAGATFPAFNPMEELWGDYESRFMTFCEANFIAENRWTPVFLTSQSKTTYQLVKTTAAQFKEPRSVDQLSWNDIKDIMSTHFGSRKFVVRERHRFYTELSRKSNETVRELAARVREKALTCDFPSISDPLEEALKTGFICAVNSEAVLKAVFHKSSDDLTFAQVVEIAAEVEDTSHTAKEQMSNQTEERRYGTLF
ncbi:hypothetical protein RF11_04521 [Thelohanellus kitauei]|uniref:Retrotransposon gag domain-containing protein n=1 Tax=Thelohanellus kitauei TaxID=669202 RepID=A0A0C2JEK4_THEKT|nr:hypothetical protein RF11_04521 [Thelohanellus kitauei]